MPTDIPAAQRYRPEDRIMQGVIPDLCLPGQRGAAADVYIRAFGTKDIGRMPMEDKPGRVMHLQLEINGGAPMLNDHAETSSAVGGDGPIPRGHLQRVVPDGRAWWNRAIAAGCSVMAPLRAAVPGRYLGASGRSVRAEMVGVDTRSCALGQGGMSPRVPD